jgi:DNA-binding response OmpR family regulator
MPKRTLAVIDDDKHLAGLLTDYLEERGFSVLTAYDGSSGVTVIKAGKPGLIVLDVDMPVMSGLQVLEVLRRDPETKTIPVIMLTGVVSDQVYPHIAKMPKVSHIKKPVNLEDLYSMVKHYLPGDPSE